ncbi:hypothetical protein FGO68_gene11911 [Halteria grandinella]|uniref:Uncharacterized protein n=1 Tax=Halteria grandinella TaxID=5974 RepID=A0A8J8NNQ0_HALGN|nr:hypothetical protein FGO68_gene11911 [Halteria grandinella]
MQQQSLLQQIKSIAGPQVECKIVVDHERGDVFREDDDVKGVVIITSAIEQQRIDHDGIKITLIGMIEHKQHAATLWGAAQNHMFLQITRELEFQGDFSGTIQRDFLFSKVGFTDDSYLGIGLNLKYLLKVEMTYQSTLRKAQMVEVKELMVVNEYRYLVNKQDSMDIRRPILIPSIRFTMQPKNQTQIQFQLQIKKTKINIAQENIQGLLKVKNASTQASENISSFCIEILQQEIQSSTKAQATDGGLPPFEIRTLVKYEIADGCPVIDDKIPFTIPLKGMDNITPTLKNVINKFSVRYFIKLGMTEVVEGVPTEVWSKPFEIIFYK